MSWPVCRSIRPRPAPNCCRRIGPSHNASRPTSLPDKHRHSRSNHHALNPHKPAADMTNLTGSPDGYQNTDPERALPPKAWVRQLSDVEDEATKVSATQRSGRHTEK